MDHFDILISPLITEKTTMLRNKNNQIVFKVNKKANKINIKKAFEKIFNVKVENVSVLNVISKKTGSRSKYKGIISGYKKAIITISKNQIIDLFNLENKKYGN